jgi:hypothetical protein
MTYHNKKGPGSTEIESGIDISGAQITLLAPGKYKDTRVVRLNKHKGYQKPTRFAVTSGRARASYRPARRKGG